MALGVLVELHRQRVSPVTGRLALPTALLILVGLAIALNALAGMVGSILEKPVLLKVVSIEYMFITKLDRSLMIRRRKNPETLKGCPPYSLSCMYVCVSVSVSVCNRATEYTF